MTGKSDEQEKPEKRGLGLSPDILRRETSIKDKSGQADWRETQKKNMLGQDESATDIFYKSAGTKPAGQKFELVEEKPSSLKLQGQIEVNEHCQTSSADNCGSKPTEVDSSSFEALVAGLKFASLPSDKQAEILLTAMHLGVDEFKRQESERFLGTAIGTTQGVGNVAVNLAKIADFCAYCVINDNVRAGEMGQEFGNSVGQTIVSGVRLFHAAQQYSSEVGSTGDYAKPLKDLYSVGNMLDHEWSKLPPREQERVKYEFISQMAADGLVGNASAGMVGKARKFTEILDVMAEQAAIHGRIGLEGAGRTSKLISRQIQTLTCRELAAEGGLKIPAHGSIEDGIMRMVGRSGEHPPGKSLFLAPARNKILSSKEIEAFGGAERLESMSAGELAEVGLRRYQLPRLKLESDSFSIKATIPDHPRTYFRAETPGPGVVSVTDIFKGTLPDGSGCHIMAEALRGHSKIPYRQLIITNISNPETRAAFAAGIPPEDTLLSKSAAKALRVLGVQARAYRYEWNPQKECLNIVIDTGR